MLTPATTNEDAVQQQILQAAQKLFQRNGYHKVTMDDVAKAIGKGRSSLYYYYKSKDEIFLAVMETQLNAVATELSRAIAKESSVSEKIRVLFVTKLKLSKKRNNLYNAVDTGIDAEEVSNYAKIKQHLHNCMIRHQDTMFKQILIDGMTQGHLKTFPKHELAALIFVLQSTLSGLKREMVIAGDFTQIEPAVAIFINVLLEGLKA